MCIEQFGHNKKDLESEALESVCHILSESDRALIQDVAAKLLGEYGDSIRPLIKQVYFKAVVDNAKEVNISTSSYDDIQTFDENSFLIELSSENQIEPLDKETCVHAFMHIIDHMGEPDWIHLFGRRFGYRIWPYFDHLRKAAEIACLPTSRIIQYVDTGESNDAMELIQELYDLATDRIASDIFGTLRETASNDYINIAFELANMVDIHSCIYFGRNSSYENILFHCFEEAILGGDTMSDHAVNLLSQMLDKKRSTAEYKEIISFMKKYHDADFTKDVLRKLQAHIGRYGHDIIESNIKITIVYSSDDDAPNLWLVASEKQCVEYFLSNRLHEFNPDTLLIILHQSGIDIQDLDKYLVLNEREYKFDSIWYDDVPMTKEDMANVYDFWIQKAEEHDL